jgi:hypothetical protein
MVELTTPDGGNCFGQPGQDTYLVTKAGQGWRQVLSAEPGSISVLKTRHDGYADLELNWLGMCVYGLLLEQRQVCPGRFPSPRDRRPADHGHAAQGDPGPVTAA